MAWLLLRSAAVSRAALQHDVSAADRAFYEGKIAAAKFFAREVLPVTVAQASIATAVDGYEMNLDEAGF